MQINNQSLNLSMSDHIRRKKKMSDSQELMNEAYSRALSGGKNSYS